MGEPSLALLIGLVLVFRIAGGAARLYDGAPLRVGAGDTRSLNAAPLRLLGWLLGAVAAWLAVAAAGGFAPVGLALFLGVGFTFVDHFRKRTFTCVIGELVIVIACATASIPALTWSTIAVSGAALLLGSIVIDRLLTRFLIRGPSGLSPVRRVALGLCILLPVWLWVGHGLAYPQQREAFLEQKWPQIRRALGPFFAVARAEVGEAVELPGGAVGWMTLPPGPPPYRPAILFHGADEEGSYQRGALFLRRTLRGVGFAVLAVDAPGFGASDPPSPLRRLEAWDPEPVSRAAARYLDSVPEVEGSILAVGHSMGATRALRFLDIWVGASAAVIAGATVMPAASEDERLYDRVLDDFDIEDSGLSPAFVRRTRDRYFNNDDAATSLPTGHAPVFFLRFAYDYENIIEGRNELFGMIPGRKVQWELRSDHQFASSRVEGVLIGDWQLMRRLRIALQRFLDGRAPRSGERLRFAPRR